MFRSESMFNRQQTEFFKPEQKKRGHWRKLIVIACLIMAGWQFGQGTYIHMKAQLAQLLIEKAWEKSLRTEQPVPPWGWADTWPIARLNFPELNEQLYVLAGSTDAIIAFGPGHLVQSAFPGQPGNSVLIGHRDTHFYLLKHMKTGELIEVETEYGPTLYEVTSRRIAHKRQVDLIEPVSETTLTLITCYPFDAVSAGTEHRFILTAVKVDE